MSVIPPEDILKYINEARTNPLKFSEYIKRQIDSFIDEDTLPLKPGCNYSTNEGKKVWLETYKLLQTHQKRKPYEINAGLTLAAQDHAIDMVNKNFFAHNSSDGTSFSARIQKRCGKANGSCSECLGSQFKVQGRNHALQTILGLIIDDGVPSRGHRKSILSADYHYIGCCSKVQGDKIITVIDFHSENLKVIDSKGNTQNVGNNLIYDKPTNQQTNSFGSFGKNDHFGKQFEVGFQGGFGNKIEGNFQVASNSSNKTTQRYIVSQSSNTKSSTKNGVTTKVKTTKIKYSDGTEEENVEESSHS